MRDQRFSSKFDLAEMALAVVVMTALVAGVGLAGYFTWELSLRHLTTPTKAAMRPSPTASATAWATMSASPLPVILTKTATPPSVTDKTPSATPMTAPVTATAQVTATSTSPAAAPATTLPSAGGQSQKTAPDGMQQLFVPAGEFTMGRQGGVSNPHHPVSLDDFWIDRTEVTNGRYALCVAAGACTSPALTGSASREVYYGEPAFADFPVIGLNWEQARQYCRWAGRDLPTEAQWEKAARGLDERRYPWGNERPSPLLTNIGNYVGDTVAAGDTRYVADLSPYGARGMGGNVQEWVLDWYAADYYSRPEAAINPTGPATGVYKVVRGSSWLSSDDANGASVTVRYFVAPSLQVNYIGFRCAEKAAP